jgi:excisionase family DNA binding protein
MTTLEDTHTLPPWVPPKFVERRFGLSKTTVHDLLTSGRIESVRIGRCRRISADAIRKFEASLGGSIH